MSTVFYSASDAIFSRKYLKVWLSAKPASSIGVSSRLVGLVDSGSQSVVWSIKEGIGDGMELETNDQLCLVDFWNDDKVIDTAILRTEKNRGRNWDFRADTVLSVILRTSLSPAPQHPALVPISFPIYLVSSWDKLEPSMTVNTASSYKIWY